MLCYAHASSLNSWAPDPDLESANSDPLPSSSSSSFAFPYSSSTTLAPTPPPESANTIRSLRGRRLGSRKDQAAWTIIPAKSRNITTSSATAVIRRKNSQTDNFRPLNATRALSGAKRDPDDALVNGEFISKRVIGNSLPFSLLSSL